MKKTLPIWKYWDAAERAMLQTPAEAVVPTEIATPEFQQLIDQMIATMRRADGVGLAAPQVGRSIQLAIVLRLDDSGAEPFVCINPTVDPSGVTMVTGEEGCLSIPEVYGLVPRFQKVTIQALDRHGASWTLAAEDMTARIIQHEVDHLHGRLFIERATKITAGAEKLA